MRFIFRADASLDIGSGHVMRSSVLAEEAISRGFECIFVGRIWNLPWVSERIANLGFSKLITNECDFEPQKKSDILILDSYSIPISNLFISKKNWKLVLSVCDAISPKYESDVELRPGLETVYFARSKPIVLSGPNYILIRKGIQKSNRVNSFRGTPRVLIVGGGSDPYGFVESIAEVLGSVKLKMDVYAFTDRPLPKDSHVRFFRHDIGFDLDMIANSVDVVFTTASTLSLEFIAREIPAGVSCAVDNQKAYYDELGRLKYASQIGVYNPRGVWEFNLPAIKELLVSQNQQQMLKNAMDSLIDLRGASRVIDTLVELSEKTSR